MAWKPVLSTWPQKRRNLLFGPIGIGIFLVVFLSVGFPTSDPFIAGLVAIPAAIAGAWALLGWPVLRLKDGRPLVEPKYKPYLFFALAPAFAIVGYVLFGILITKLPIPTALIVPISITLAIVLGCALAYFLVGFPHAILAVRKRYKELPPERRPFLFFPLFAIIFLVLYIGLGAGTTQALGRFADKTVFLLNIQVLLLLPFTLLVSALAAYLLVGFPKPERSLRESLPKVGGRHRPRALILTFLVVGIPLTVGIGYLLTTFANGGAASSAFLPETLVLPLALVLGYSLALGFAVAVWGTPARWRKYDDYKPGLSPRARLGASGAAGIAVALACTVAFGLADIDLFWGMLVGVLLGIAVGVLISGAHRRIAQRRGADTLLPDLPDRVKSVLLISTWLVLALVIFSVLTYALPDIVGWNAGIALLAGLAVAFVLVEQALIREWRDDMRATRQRNKAWAKHRKEELKKGATAQTDEPAGP